MWWWAVPQEMLLVDRGFFMLHQMEASLQDGHHKLRRRTPPPCSVESLAVAACPPGAGTGRSGIAQRGCRAHCAGYHHPGPVLHLPSCARLLPPWPLSSAYSVKTLQVAVCVSNTCSTCCMPSEH